MAEKRMFSRAVIDSDTFIDMPISARLLYYDLGMRADDDGFVNSPKKITRMIGASQDDLKILIQKRFIIPFESGVIVIRHWRVHNYIPKDRYHETTFREEMESLTIKDNREYVSKLDCGVNTDCIQDVSQTDTERIQDVSSSDTQNRIDKNRVDKNSIDKSNISCSEPLTSSAPEVPALILNDNSEWIPSRDDLEGWQQLYTGVDVIKELARMREWCKSNPTRRKTRKGIRRFVQTWLDRQQNQSNKYGAGTAQKDKFTQRMEEMQNWGKKYEDGNQP